ncbi:Fe-S cluster protein [Candidatus Woesearchaeota archaeon]|nr:Fe-S cluster protein [Candidatus Woesearchaeota archaeon]
MSAYRDLIFDLYKQPLNKGRLEHPTHRARCHNPVCGDDITMELDVDNNMITRATFHGTGCAICIASASLLTEQATKSTTDNMRKFGKDEVEQLLGVTLGPVRLKCALLPLETLHKALGGSHDAATH